MGNCRGWKSHNELRNSKPYAKLKVYILFTTYIPPTTDSDMCIYKYINDMYIYIHIYICNVYHTCIIHIFIYVNPSHYLCEPNSCAPWLAPSTKMDALWSSAWALPGVVINVPRPNQDDGNERHDHSNVSSVPLRTCGLGCYKLSLLLASVLVNEFS